MKNVEDIYPLSPMQEMMLLHAQSRPGDDTLFNQIIYDLSGPLDVDAFRSTWEDLTARHASLRTAFAWTGLKRPMQIVRRDVELPFTFEDWSDARPDDHAARLANLLETDRANGFDLLRAPLNRITLIRTAMDSALWIWSSHHLVIDRWCLSALFDEFATAFAARRRGRAGKREPAPPFGRYIAWLEARNTQASMTFWHELLGDFPMPSAMTRPNATGMSQDFSDTSRTVVDPETSERLERFARSHGATMNSLFQAAWALVVNRYTAAVDIVIGLTVAGRPPDLDGVESIVGTFVNNVPVRWRFSDDATVGGALREAQSLQHRRLAHEHVALSAIQDCSAIPAGKNLIDTLVVWLAAQPLPDTGDVTMTQRPGAVRSAYPMTLAIAESKGGYELMLAIQAGVEPAAAAEELLAALQDALAALCAATPETRFSDLPGFRAARAGQALPVTRLRALPQPARIGTLPDELGEGREHLQVEMVMDMLRADWCSVLDLEEVAADDDFFALGGHSVRAASLHARVASAARSRIPMLALFRRSTLRGMAEAICEERWPLFDRICTPLATGGDGTPLFLVASPEVNTVGFALLARHLSSARPIYLLQAPPDSARVRRLSPSELPGIAGTYLEAMRDVQPTGPYLLLGTCVGAHLSREITHLLEAEGERADFVGIVDTYAYYTVTKFIVVHRLLKRLRWYRRRMAELLAGGSGGRVAMLGAIIRRKLRRAGATGVRGRNEWIDDVGRARPEATVAPVNAPITVFRIARQAFWRVPDRALGWGRYTRDVSVVDLSAPRHPLILREPGVREVAARIDECLGSTAERKAAA